MMLHALVLSLLMAAALPQAPATTVATRATPTRSAEVRMDHISVVSVGEGSPVILIPGLATPRSVWDGIVPDLARDHRVLLVQVNGFGGDAPGANLDSPVLDGVVADLATLIAREKLEKPAVIGHSLGGLAAMMLASRHGEAVGRLMVVDALPFIGVLFGAASVEAIRPQAERMRAMTAALPASAAPVTQDPGGIWSNTAAGRIRVANWTRASDPRVTARALYDDMVTDLRGTLGAITARPFTVLYATGAGPQAAALWQRDYAGSPATLVPVAESYHFIMLDQPAAFARAVTAFLAH